MQLTVSCIQLNLLSWFQVENMQQDNLHKDRYNSAVLGSWNIFYFQLTIILGHIEHKHTSCTPSPVSFSL